MSRLNWFETMLVAALMSASSWVCAAEFAGRLRWQTDYKQAHQVRVQHGTPMLVFLTTDGCPFCHKMLETTYRDQAVAAEVAARYVPTVVNAAQQQTLAQQFGVRVYPTTFLIDSDNRIVDKIEGYLPADKFLNRLDQASARMAANRATISTR